MILRKNQIFANVGFKSGLSEKAVRNGYITITEHAVNLVFQILSTAILARLILPDSYGLISMVSIVTNFVAIFKDAGLSMATIQKNEITEAETSNLFWINCAISVALGIIVALSAPFVSAFYGRRELIEITVFMSLSLLVSGLSIQHQALLKRHMRFDAIFIINVISFVLSRAVMIVLALMHLEYRTLIIGALLQALLTLLLTLFFCRWIPRKYDKNAKISDMIRYGADLTIFDFISYFTRNLDNVLIGRFDGSEALGLYSKAYSIVYMPIDSIRNPINSVAIPVMTRITDDSARFRKYFSMQVAILSVLIVPLMTCVYINAHDIIIFLFGENWLGMEFAFKMLTLTAIFQPVMGIRGSAMVALGLSRLYLITGVISAAVTVSSFAIGIRFGMNGVAVSYFISFVLNQLISFPILFANTYLKFRDLAKGLYPTVISVVFAFAAGCFLSTHLGGLHLIIRLAVSFSVMYLAFLAVLLIIPEGRSQLKLILEKMKIGRARTDV